MRQAVIFIHGIGNQQTGYSEKLEDNISDTFYDLIDIRDHNIIFKEVLWAPILQKQQNELWKRVKKGDGVKDLDSVKLRKAFIGFGGDAVAYQNDEIGRETYNAIHNTISERISSIKNEINGEEFELTIVAHSLGSVIASNFIFDNNKKYQTGDSNRIDLVNFFTLGSPIAVWLLRYKDFTAANSVVKVTRPNGAWINILDDDDIIAYPLKKINAAHNEAVDMDYITEIGNPLKSSNLLSHTEYWFDRNVYKPIAKKLALDYKRITDNYDYSWAEYRQYIKKLWNF